MCEEKKRINVLEYVYQYKDHLNSVRLSYSDLNGDGSVDSSEIIEENSYYPFGGKIQGVNNVVSAHSNGTASKYKYNGKELQDELDLDMYDYGARMYDPAIGRWNGVDPLAHRYDNSSPYSYVFNNPINLFDPDGMRVVLGRNQVDDRDLTTQEIVMLMAAMQNMTDDKLRYNGKTGEVEIAEKGKGDKTEGTELIRGMIEHKKTATINYNVSEKTNEDGDHYGMPGASSGAPGNEGTDPNFFNGIGGDVEINFGTGGKYLYQDFDGGEIKEEQISLTGLMNHEFSHAIGQMDGVSRGKPTRKNPRGRMILNYYTDNEGTKVEKIPLEEATATFIQYRRFSSNKRKNYPTENSLNKEQGRKKRLNYGH